MFIAAAIFVVALIGLLAFQKKLEEEKRSKAEIRKQLTAISQAILEKRMEAAKKGLFELAKKGHGGQDALYYALRLHREAGEYGRAVELAQIASPFFSSSKQLEIEVAGSLLALKRPKEAFERLKSVRELLTADSELELFAEAACPTQPEMALALVEKLLEASVRPSTWMIAAKATDALERPLESLFYCKRAIQLGGCGLEVDLLLARGLLKSGSVDEAIERFQSIRELHPDAPEALLGLANAFQQGGEPHKALALLGYAAGGSREDPRVILQGAILALLLEKEGVANDFFKRLKEKGADRELYLNQGAELERLGRVDLAQALYRAMT